MPWVWVILAQHNIYSLGHTGTTQYIQFGSYWHNTIYTVWVILAQHNIYSLGPTGTTHYIQFGSYWHNTIYTVWVILAQHNIYSLGHTGTTQYMPNLVTKTNKGVLTNSFCIYNIYSLGHTGTTQYIKFGSYWHSTIYKVWVILAQHIIQSHMNILLSNFEVRSSPLC